MSTTRERQTPEVWKINRTNSADFSAAALPKHIHICPKRSPLISLPSRARLSLICGFKRRRYQVDPEMFFALRFSYIIQVQNEPEEAVYGYYGRVAGPSPPSVTMGSYAAVSNPDNTIHEFSASSKALGSDAGLAGVDDAGVGGQSGDSECGEDDEVFVPDFGVPGGIAVPSTPRQHIMMVGTARTAMRSPQVGLHYILKEREAQRTQALGRWSSSALMQRHNRASFDLTYRTKSLE